MSYQLKGMFSDSFFGDIYEPIKEDKPTNIVNAILNITAEQREEIKKEVFGFDNKNIYLSNELIFYKILETNTVRNIDTPVEVYIDPEGYFSILVY